MNIKEMSVNEMLHSMNDADLENLYFSMLRIDEVGFLGNELLKDLWLAVKTECESR